MPENDIETASRLINEKKYLEARPILENFIKHNRDHIPAWKLYAETWQSIEDRKRVWGYCLKINPNNLEVKQALADLNQKAFPQKQVFQEERPRKKPRSFLFISFSILSILCIIAIIIGTINIALAQPIDPAPYLHTQPVEYYLYVPKNYSDEKIWPLFVGIHGSGSSGLECWNLWQAYAEKEGFVLLCPTIPGDAGGYYSDVGERVVWSAVEQVRKDYLVSSKMFFAGFSAGAYFVQIFTSHYPNSVSGLAILSTGYYVTNFQSRIPILLVIGGADNSESLQANEKLFIFLQNNGFDVELHVLPGVGHWVTNKAKELTIELFRKTTQK